MDLIQDMKAGPSAIQAAWSTRTPSRTKHARNWLVATFTVLTLAFLYITFGNTSLVSFTTRLSVLFGNGVNSASLGGDKYLLGVGKADITGYELLYNNKKTFC